MARIQCLRTLAIMTLLIMAVGNTLAAAQEATPEASPEADSAAFLFVQTFTSGTWVPAGEDEFTLTLNGVATTTIYFSERPDRVVGLMPTIDLLDSLGFTEDDPPNAALVLQLAEGDQEVLIIELIDPDYDATAGVLTYQAKVLASYDEEALASLAERQTDTEIPAAFDEGSLFIDHHRCPEPFGCL